MADSVNITIQLYKARIKNNPASVDSVISSIPRGVAQALARDPEVGPIVAEALSRLYGPDAVKEAAAPLSPPPPAAPAARRPDEEAEAARHRELAAQAAEKAKQLQAEQMAAQAREDEERKQTLFMKIQTMDVAQKTRLAREGDKDARSILIKDGNILVCQAVMENPKITLQEIEIAATMKNTPEEIIKTIADNRDWCKTYSIIIALANNPKTPISVGHKLIRKLRTRDLKNLTKSKGVSDAIRNAAIALFRQKGY